MMQNLATLRLTAEQLTAVDAALTELENQLAGLITLPLSTKRSARRMGPKSEAFCRQALRVLEQNPQIVPPNMVLTDALEDLASIEELRPRMVRLARLSERAADTNTALGIDVMSMALQGYQLLKVSGRAEGLETARQQLSTRFSKSPRRATQLAPAPLPLAEAA
jgi:hypothetical protein